MNHLELLEKRARKNISRVAVVRFLLKVKYRNKQCWLWNAAFRGGYGAFAFKPHTAFAHRASYIIFNGDIGDKDLVLHKCDNKACVNPDHLYLGDYKDNARDAVERGRIATGDRNGMRLHPGSRLYGEKCKLSKLKTNEVRKIAALLKRGKSLKSIAKIFNVNFTTIWKIKVGESWSHITGFRYEN